MKRLVILGLVTLCVPSVAWAVIPDGWISSAPGVYNGSGSQDACDFAQFGPATFPNGNPLVQPYTQTTANVYIVWYNNAIVPWTLAQQQAVVAFFTNLNGSSWWNAVTQSFPNNTNKGASTVSTISITNCFSGIPAHCYTDPELEGTGAGFDSTNVMNNAILGGHLPADVNGIYVILPSTNNITSQPSIGYNDSFISAGWGHALVSLREWPCTSGCIGECPFSNYPTPNMDCQFDTQLWIMSAELAASVSSFGLGWHADYPNLTGSLPQVPCYYGLVHEQCTGFSIARAFETPSNTVSNWTAQLSSRYDFLLHSIWQNHDNGYCDVAQSQPYATVPCNVDADCPAFSDHCSTTLSRAGCRYASCGGHCVSPLPTLPLFSSGDGIKNGIETDVDCGGGVPATCSLGRCAARIRIVAERLRLCAPRVAAARHVPQLVDV